MLGNHSFKVNNISLQNCAYKWVLLHQHAMMLQQHAMMLQQQAVGCERFYLVQNGAMETSRRAQQKKPYPLIV